MKRLRGDEIMAWFCAVLFVMCAVLLFFGCATFDKAAQLWHDNSSPSASTGTTDTPSPSGTGQSAGTGTDPAATSGTTTADAVPVADIVWHGGDPSGYKLTANLKGVKITGGSTGACTICWEWDVPAWPTRTKGVIGNQWVAYRDSAGKWQAGVWEMVRAEASKCRTSEAGDGEPPLIQAHGPIGSWTPTSGAEVLVMMSTPTRGADAAGDVTKERSNVAKTVWP